MAANSSAFAVTPTAQRDLARFNAFCRRPGTATHFLTSEIQVARAKLGRVLVLDGRCFCKANGIGNLFGDYVVWFLAAALSGRALFIDWTDSAAEGPRHTYVGTWDERLKAGNATKCFRARFGSACQRIPRRFDLGAHFESVGGHSWRWTAAMRQRLVALHGRAAETVVESPHEHETVDCMHITRLLTSADVPWLTIKVSDDTATALLPFCTGKRSRVRAGQPVVGRRAWPDASSIDHLLDTFGQRLRSARRASSLRAAQKIDEARRELFTGIGRRRMGSALWSTPLAVPKAARGEAQLPIVSALSTCVLNAMVRPTAALRDHLTPLHSSLPWRCWPRKASLTLEKGMLGKGGIWP